METLDKYFRQLTQTAFARYGFAQSELVGRWPEIAGEALARYSAPERIKYPRGSGETAQKTGGTLIVRAAPGRALELQYAVPAIIERINRFLGYGAIAAIKIVQAPSWPSQSPAPGPAKEPKIPFEQELAAVEDESLRAALTRLGEAVARTGASSPQVK